MPIKRRSKELVVGKRRNYTARIGTMNVNEPKTLYVNIHGSIPKEKVVNINGRVGEIRLAVKNRVDRMVKGRERLNDNFLYEFNINEDNLMDGKKKVVNIEFFIKQNGNNLIGFDDMTDGIKGDVMSISEMLCRYEDGEA